MLKPAGAHDAERSGTAVRAHAVECSTPSTRSRRASHASGGGGRAAWLQQARGRMLRQDAEKAKREKPHRSRAQRGRRAERAGMRVPCRASVAPLQNHLDADGPKARGFGTVRYVSHLASGTRSWRAPCQRGRVAVGLRRDRGRATSVRAGRVECCTVYVVLSPLAPGRAPKRRRKFRRRCSRGAGLAGYMHSTAVGAGAVGCSASNGDVESSDGRKRTSGSTCLPVAAADPSSWRESCTPVTLPRPKLLPSAHRDLPTPSRACPARIHAQGCTGTLSRSQAIHGRC
ncbi:hypothetical protein T440DRAFT_544823 [Plenodomus tracheiphilus IPT5]|uniref:Uncharacterized protein n=1 Tax=Plenodomus tracheiphilus IPT5 TaxID=1408161 RepID=A0A6A7BGG4_9PLEO|nr:hypothetical protein T440DRAFT_544823 [Plenodomus tracheiphilus IPT5]